MFTNIQYIYLYICFFLNSYRIDIKNINVYSVAVQIEMYYDSGKLAVEHCEAK